MAGRLSRMFLIVLAGLFILPVLFTLVGSLMSEVEVTARFGEQGEVFGRSRGLSLIPDKVTLSQFYELLIENFSYLGMFWHSVFYALLITVGANLVIIPLAYVFAKIKFKGANALFFLYLVTMMMPFQTTLLPIYIVLSRTGLLNTQWALILPSIFAPLGVFLLRQFMRGIPDELIEAASLETNSIFKLLTRIIIPLSKNGLIAMNILIFAEAWNMVEQPLLFLDDTTKYPLSAAMNGIMSGNLSVAFAGSVLFLAPVVVLYLCFEEQIVGGLETFKW
jgi:multiple sugar transport system permease protein